MGLVAQLTKEYLSENKDRFTTFLQVKGGKVILSIHVIEDDDDDEAWVEASVDDVVDDMLAEVWDDPKLEEVLPYFERMTAKIRELLDKRERP